MITYPTPEDTMNNAPWIDELHRIADWLRDNTVASLKENEANADRLVELANKLDEDKIVHVTAYEVERHYGGPEEGGWWYNWYELIESVPIHRHDADEVAETLKGKYQDRVQGDIYSVLGGVAISVFVEDNLGEYETKVRPHYE